MKTLHQVIAGLIIGQLLCMALSCTGPKELQVKMRVYTLEWIEPTSRGGVDNYCWLHWLSKETGLEVITFEPYPTTHTKGEVQIYLDRR